MKAATYEHLGPLLGGPPARALFALYARWAAGGWGMVVTGNVQVAPDHLSLGRDMTLPRALNETGLAPFRALASAARGEDTCVVMQLSHAGRQSPVLLGGRLFTRAAAPSAIPLGRRGGWFARAVYGVLFPTPRALMPAEIDDIVGRFVLGARVAHAAGFDGVELHAAHGYLLSQFLSPKSNTRTDAYSVDNTLALIRRIVHGIREELLTTFAVGVKISSADIVEAGAIEGAENAQAEARALGYVREIARWGTVDFIEISGGDYENPDFMLSARQVFFAKFARAARTAIQELPAPQRPLVILTGGLNTARRVYDALANGHADLVGIARAATLCPDLPQRFAATGPHGEPSGPPEPVLDLRDGALSRALRAVLSCLGILPLPKILGAGVGMAWYTVTLRQLARGQAADFRMGGLGAIVRMWEPELRMLVFAVAAVVLVLAVLWMRIE